MDNSDYKLKHIDQLRGVAIFLVIHISFFVRLALVNLVGGPFI
jgi:hypothetical protein